MDRDTVERMAMARANAYSPQMWREAIRWIDNNPNVLLPAMCQLVMIKCYASYGIFNAIRGVGNPS